MPRVNRLQSLWVSSTQANKMNRQHHRVDRWNEVCKEGCNQQRCLRIKPGLWRTELISMGIKNAAKWFTICMAAEPPVHFIHMSLVNILHPLMTVTLLLTSASSQSETTLIPIGQSESHTHFVHIELLCSAACVLGFTGAWLSRYYL